MSFKHRLHYKGIIAMITLCNWSCIESLSPEISNIAHPNSLNPVKFGHGGVSLVVEEYEGFLDPKTFITEYAVPSVPVKFRNAAKHFPAYKRWASDDYFLSLDIPEDSFVAVEPHKKENRTATTADVHFQEFVRTYNHSDHYMVNSLPDFLGDDVLIPWSLQCNDIITDNIVESIMWFSSGGTKSVVHSDSVDNMNCLFSGNKSFVFVDPQKYWEQVPIDHPEGLYSGIDVDNVDFEMYPHLKDVEYYHVNLSAGDCLFIPYRWIHQVRSYGRNIAVNIWWDHHNNEFLDTNTCESKEDATLTVAKVDFIGFDAIAHSPEQLRDQFKEFSRAKNGLSIEDLKYYFSPDADLLLSSAGVGHTIPLQKIVKSLDIDKNGKVILNEVLVASDEVWDTVSIEMEKYLMIVHHVLEEMEEESDEELPEKDEL